MNSSFPYASRAALFCALFVIAVSVWGYVDSGAASFTALIPAEFGVVLTACAIGMRSDRKVAAYFAAAASILLIAALSVPLKGALAREDGLALLRVGMMMAAAALIAGLTIRLLIKRKS